MLLWTRSACRAFQPRPKQHGRIWTGEGLGVLWPGADFAILVFAGLFVMIALTAVALTRRGMGQALP